MNKVLLNEENWLQLKNQFPGIALLPWGATEPHNYHLPYGTDNFLAGNIAEISAKKAAENGVLSYVLPTIPLGVQNPGQIELPFCLHTRPSTQFFILKDIVTALNLQGIKKLIIINAHGGNDFKTFIRELQPDFPTMLICVINYWTIGPDKEIFTEPGDHAGELETSLMLHFFPHLVNMDEAGNGETKKSVIDGFNSKMAWIPRNWSKVSVDTGIGDPKFSTAEKGQQFAEIVTDRIARFICDLDKVTPETLY
jgi:creatinine amidohydrolase